MRPSSIFSSETLSLRGYRPWGLVIAGFVFLVLELGYSRNPPAWTSISGTSTGLISIQDEIVGLVGIPRVLVLGNSRMIGALPPQVLERELGLGEGSILNLSIQAARPFDYLTFYQRHRAKLGDTQLIILGLDDNQFGQEMNSAEQRFRYFASLEQRRSYDGDRRLSYVMGFFLRSLDAGGVAKAQLRSILKGIPRFELTDDLRILWKQQSERGPHRVARKDLDRIVSRNYSSYQPSSSQESYLSQLLEWCREDGIEVLPVRLPVRDEYFDRVVQLEPALWQESNLVYPRIPTTILLFDRGSSISMKSEHFVDYGHFSASGARVFSALLADEIEKRLAAAE